MISYLTALLAGLGANVQLTLHTLGARSGGLALCLAWVGFIPLQAATVLPIEVMGSAGTTAAATLQAPGGSGIAHLWLRVHNLNYQTKASVRLNSGAWTAITNSTATVSEPAKSFGGIGGGFTTIDLSLPLTGGVDGANTIEFRFNQIDFDSSGYRVLALDLRNGVGSSLLSPGQFIADDPATWSAPLSSAGDIAAGDALWSNATLLAKPGGATIQARCSDCHASEGYDLKYFNYSNTSIIERAKFHGLSELEAKQIASYIRTLPIPHPGRPWNPPFQPGPGVDAKPAIEWSAGAGLEQGLIDESTSRAQLPGGGTVSGAIAQAYTDGVSLRTINRRELAIALQFPDWNRWLPRTHPVDIIGRSAWESSDLALLFDRIHGRLAGSTTYGFGITGIDQYRMHPLGLSLDISTWDKGFAQAPFNSALGPFAKGPDNIQTRNEAQAQMGLRSAFAVRLWELHQTFDLYGILRRHFGQFAESRTMLTYRSIFNLSPAVADFNNTYNIHGDSAAQPANQAIASQWYELQLVLNAGARNNPNGGFQTIDWGYMSGIFNGEIRLAGQPSPTRAALFALKAIQEHDNGYAPNGPGRIGEEQNPWWAFNWRDNLAEMDSASLPKMATAITAANAEPLVEDVRRIWLEQVGRYSDQQWNEGLYWGGGGTYGTSPRTYILGTNPNGELEAADRLLTEIRGIRTRYAKLPHVITNAEAEIGRLLWPGKNGANDPVWLAEKRIDGARAAPTATATAGLSAVTITWAPVAGALSYNVKRIEGSPARAVVVKFLVPGTSWTEIQRRERSALSYAVSANFANPTPGAGPVEGPDSLPASAAPLAGLVSRWRFDEASGDFLDTGAAANHAKPIGATSRVPGRAGSALATDPADAEHAYASTKRSFHETLGGTMTCAAWFRTTAAPTGIPTKRLPGILGVVAASLPQVNDAVVFGQLQSDGRIGFLVGAAGIPLATPSPVNTGTWRHLAVTRDATTGSVILYLDGIRVASAILGSGMLGTRCNSLGRIDGVRSIFPGTIDDVRLYDRVLSDAEIDAIYQDAAGDAAAPRPPDLLVTDATGVVAPGSTRTLSQTMVGSAKNGSFTVTNLGGANLLFTPAVSVQDLVNCTASASTPGISGLSAGTSGTLAFSITASSAAPWSARLVITSNDPDTPVQNVFLTGTGKPPSNQGTASGSAGSSSGSCGSGLSAVALACCALFCAGQRQRRRSRYSSSSR